MTDNPVFERIRKDISENDVVLYMKGNKLTPHCGFSSMVVQVLERLGVDDFKDVNVLEDQDVREAIKAFTDWPTIPQLYVKGEFVGGADIIRDMYQAGELQELFKTKGIISDAA